MRSYSKSILLAFLIIAIVLGIVWEFNPLKTAEERLASIPSSGTHFAGKDIPLTESEKLALGAAHAMKRLYIYRGRQLIVTFTDGSNNRNAVHDPAYCFLGSGWQITSDSSMRLENGVARLLSLQQGQQSTELAYWFSDGSQSYHSIIQYWMNTTLRRLTLGHSGDEPILILIRPVQPGSLNWDEIAHHFIPLLGL